MVKLRVYADSSVFGGTEDEEFAAASQHFFERIEKGKFLLVVSAEVLRELELAPGTVRKVLESLPPDVVESVPVGPEVTALADAYVAAGVLGPASKSDAIHVAAATVARADVIVSWNFRHIVNLDRIRRYNGVNALNGYPPVEIRSPAELAYADEDEAI